MSGRPLRGSITYDGGSWVATLPRWRGASCRLSASFSSEKAAERWRDEQIQRLYAGHEAEAPALGTPGYKPSAARRRADERPSAAAARPPRPPSSRAGVVTTPAVDFAECARRWHLERYGKLQRAQAGRTRDVWRNIELHLLPAFGGPIELEDVPAARERVVSWTRAMAGYPPGDSANFPLPKQTYAKDFVDGLLWILSEILLYARLFGVDVPVEVTTKGVKPAVTNGVHALEPRARKKRKPKLVRLETARDIARHLHVVHQLVLWLMRIAGLRIGEAFGLLVANFVDEDGRGFLLVEAQGGTTYFVRDEDEQLTKTTRKQATKTDAGYRLIALPKQLTELIRVVIVAFHTDPATGEVEYAARLVPDLRSQGKGQSAFRSALKLAAAAVGGGSAEPDDYVIPHDMRKAYATDLAWDPSLDELLKRRAMGHRGGTDVFSLVYTLDDRLRDAMLPAAERVEADITAGIGTLIVPTTRMPSFSRDRCRERAAHAEAVLVAAGWHIDGRGPGWVSAADAAALLEMSETATRRLFPGRIPAEKVAGEWRARIEDVLAYRDRLAGWTFLEDLVDETRRSYEQLYALVKHLDLKPQLDNYSRRLLLSEDDVRVIVAECRRIDALHERAVPVAEACRVLRLKHSSVHALARNGQLSYDPETDTTGWLFITRDSLEALAAGRRRPVDAVTAGDLKVATGLDGRGLTALCAARLLVRAPRGGFTVTSVRAWATGYRPELLASPLLAR